MKWHYQNQHQTLPWNLSTRRTTTHTHTPSVETTWVWTGTAQMVSINYGWEFLWNEGNQSTLREDSKTTQNQPYFPGTMQVPTERTGHQKSKTTTNALPSCWSISRLGMTRPSRLSLRVFSSGNGVTMPDISVTISKLGWIDFTCRASESVFW